MLYYSAVELDITGLGRFNRRLSLISYPKSVHTLENTLTGNSFNKLTSHRR